MELVKTICLVFILSFFLHFLLFVNSESEDPLEPEGEFNIKERLRNVARHFNRIRGKIPEFDWEELDEDNVDFEEIGKIFIKLLAKLVGNEIKEELFEEFNKDVAELRSMVVEMKDAVRDLRLRVKEFTYVVERRTNRLENLPNPFDAGLNFTTNPIEIAFRDI